MLDRHLRPLIDPLLERLADRLARRVSADAVTVCGFALGLSAMAAIMAHAYLLGLLLLAGNRIADGLDGAIARRNGVTDLGGYLDIVLDFIIYSGVVFAFAAADPAANALPAAFLIFAFMAAKHRLESPEQGRKSLYYLGGLAEGTETITFMVVALLLPGAFPLLAWLFGAVCWVTTAARILVATTQLRGR